MLRLVTTKISLAFKESNHPPQFKGVHVQGHSIMSTMK